MPFTKRHPPVGASPGTLVFPDDSRPAKIHVTHFSPKDVREEEITDIGQLEEALSEECITWVDIQGFGDEETIRRISKIFSLHSIVIENVINIPQRPKSESFDDQMLIVTRRVERTRHLHVDSEQICIILGKTFVITFQEHYCDSLSPVLELIRGKKGKEFRSRGADYLAYAILDTIIDGYYPVLEELGEQLTNLEEVILKNPDAKLLRKLNRTKNMLINLRRSVWPQRDSINALIRGTNPYITDFSRMHFRDTYDHCVQTLEVIEMYLEMSNGLVNTYMSSVANRTNEVMKVLTIMASIFIPLTFIAGVYGMNFEFMPELHYRWSYPIACCIMLLVALGMIVFFRKKGWIGDGSDKIPK
jgi:magnesium transporter